MHDFQDKWEKILMERKKHVISTGFCYLLRRQDSRHFNAKQVKVGDSYYKLGKHKFTS